MSPTCRYGAHPGTLEQAPDGGVHCKMVPLELLEAVSPQEGVKYLRRDRIKVRVRVRVTTASRLMAKDSDYF